MGVKKLSKYPTRVPNSVYVKAKMISVLASKTMYEVATQAIREYLYDVECAKVSPSQQANEYENIFGAEKLHMWTVIVDEELWKTLKHVSIDYNLDIYKALSFAVMRYAERNYPNT